MESGAEEDEELECTSTGTARQPHTTHHTLTPVLLPASPRQEPAVVDGVQSQPCYQFLPMELNSHLRQSTRSAANLVDRLDDVHKSTKAMSDARLAWNEPVKTVLLFLKKGEPDVVGYFFEIVKYFRANFPAITLGVESDAIGELQAADTEKLVTSGSVVSWIADPLDSGFFPPDLIICLGGDGTILYAASLFQTIMPPVICFNLGSLGFLANFPIQDYAQTISRTLRGGCQVAIRMRLHCSLGGTGSLSPQVSTKRGQPRALRDVHVLNEIVIDRGPAPFLTFLEVYCDDILVTVVQGDGLIVATPTGSTAYSVSAGGSMVHPGVPAILLTPICPHSLSFRPIIIPPNARLKVVVSSQSRHSAWVSMDGRHRQKVPIGTCVHITASPWPVPTLALRDQSADWFQSLSQCLNWNNRTYQKASSQRHLGEQEAPAGEAPVAPRSATEERGAGPVKSEATPGSPLAGRRLGAPPRARATPTPDSDLTPLPE
eukprot:m.324386 g.324386  ORF g.324386 m.324386 type:complete len:489 (-) comp55539_c0_seq2:25-1491(-)